MTEGNDIALLKLKGKSKHTPATLPTASHRLTTGEMLVALGWGVGSGEHLQQAATLGVIENDICSGKDVWGDLIIDSMICAFSPAGQDVCPGMHCCMLVQRCMIVCCNWVQFLLDFSTYKVSPGICRTVCQHHVSFDAITKLFTIQELLTSAMAVFCGCK